MRNKLAASPISSPRALIRARFQFARYATHLISALRIVKCATVDLRAAGSSFTRVTGIFRRCQNASQPLRYSPSASLEVSSKESGDIPAMFSLESNIIMLLFRHLAVVLP